jgi:hypothetical protein
MKARGTGILFFGVCDWTIITVKFIIGVGMALTMFAAPIYFIRLLLGKL